MPDAHARSANTRAVDARGLRIAALLIVLGCVLGFVAGSRPLLGDNMNYGLVARSLVTEGDIQLDEFRGRIRGNTREEDGKLYNFFPLGPSLVMAPLYVATRWLVEDASRAENLAARTAVGLCFGVSLALFFRLCSRFAGISWPRALGLTFLFGFCSSQFSQHVGQLCSHGAVVPFALGAFLALTSQRKGSAFLAGSLLIIAYVMRPTAGLLLPLFAGWLFLYRRHCVVHLLLGAALSAAVMFVTNRALYGHFDPPYNRVNRLQFSALAEGLAGNLISPSRGLLLFTPWLVLSALGAWRSFRDPHVDPFFRLPAVIVVSHLLAVSSFPHWWAGHSYGPRFLAEVMPEFVLLLIPVLQWTRVAAWLGSGVGRVLFAVAIAYSFAVQMVGITRSAGNWNRVPLNVDRHPERVWDWSDPQMLRPVSDLIRARVARGS